MGALRGALGAVGGTNLAPARQDEGAPCPLLAPEAPPPPTPLMGWTLGPAPPTGQQTPGVGGKGLPREPRGAPSE